MRMHLCWGNYEGPHTHDIPLTKILDVAMRARPAGLSLEAANPRHAHEWEDLRDAKIPDGKILIPGVIDSTTNFVEHPRLVAQRICHYAEIVGRERVIAGADCGFATFAFVDNPVAPSVVWAKLATLAEGARIATARLWR
jgi:5-methyltetrahydropteroyltriglutamate--homocysteine methyltransferase